MHVPRVRRPRRSTRRCPPRSTTSRTGSSTGTTPPSSGGTWLGPRRHPATLKAHLLGELAAEQGLDAAWRLAVYRAHWLDDADVSADSVLTILAVRIGMPIDDVEALLHDPQQRHRLRQRMLVHRGDGVGGVPVLDANGTFLSPFVPEDDLRTLAELSP